MDTDEFQYIMLIREKGLDEAVFYSPSGAAAFLLTIGGALLRGFGADPTPLTNK